KSTDGIHFVEIGMVTGSGNTNQLSSYSFTDFNPGTEIGYYRLKQVDCDGNYQYLGEISAEEPCSLETATINTWYNQAGNIVVQIDTPLEETYTATLYDAMGKKISSESFMAAQGFNQFSLPITSLSGGVYFLTLDNKKEITTNKVFISY
ncbi:MAG: T9SS type A sorting domain-containing protein, partial [Flavobacteriales bacterium]